MKRIRLQHLASLPIANGLGLPGEHSDPTWPRYVRTMDIAGPRSLRDDVFASQPPSVAAAAPLQKRDIVACAAGATIGKSAMYLESDPACYAGFLVRYRANERADPRFISHWMQSKDYWSQIQAGAVKSTIENFSASKYRALQVPLWDIEEQRRIADFLDDRVARIDQIIAARRGQQALAQESLTATFAKVVKNFTRIAMRYLCQEIIVGIVIQPARLYSEAPDSVPALRGMNIGEGRIDTNSVIRISIEGHAANQRSRLREGDVVVVRTGNAGTAAVVTGEQAGWNCIDLVVVRPGPLVSSQYLELMLNGARRSVDIAAASSGSIQQHFGVNAMASLPIPFGDKRTLDVTKDLMRARETVNRAVSDLDLSVALLIEYKQSLITAAVTGELDVTTASTRIPE